MVYSRDWAVFTPAMVERLADRVPTLTFWKDGQGDARKYQRIMQTVGSRIGLARRLGRRLRAGLFRGGRAGIHSSISNIAPRLSLELGEAGLARDFGRLDVLMAKSSSAVRAARAGQGI